MTETEFESKMNLFQLEDEYAEYILQRGNRPIGNGDMLITAMEDGYLYEEFKESMVSK